MAAARLFVLALLLAGLPGVPPGEATHGCNPQDPKRVCPPQDVVADVVCSPPGIRLRWTLYDSYHEVVLRRTPDPQGQFPRSVVPAYAGWACDSTTIANTPYTYQVCARYGADSGDEFCSAPVSQVVRADTGPTSLPAPTITGTDATRDRVEIRWAASRSYNYYHVQGGRVGNPPGTVSVNGAGTSGSYADRNVAIGALYIFAVRGCGELAGRYGDQCSPWSEPRQIRVDLPPLPLTDVRVESLSPSQLRVYWRSNSDTTHVAVSGRSAPGQVRSVVISRWEGSVVRNTEGYVDVSELPARTRYLFEVCAAASGASTRTCQEVPGQTLYDAAWPPTSVRARRDATGAIVTWSNADDSVLWFEVERYEGTDQWKVMSRKLSRPNTTFTDVTAKPPAWQFDKAFIYRVCAGNVAGRTCSEPATTGISVANKPVAGKGLEHAPVIKKVEPAVVYRVDLRAGDGIPVRIAYDGTPTRAAFRVDAGTWTALELAGVAMGPATVQVTVPASAFLQSREKVDVQLTSPGGESVGTIRVLSASTRPAPADAGLADKVQGPPPGGAPGGSSAPATPKAATPEPGAAFRQGPRTTPGALPR